MDDFVEVQVVHAARDAHGPVDQEGGGDFAPRPQHLVQLALGTVFHQDTVAGRLSAHAPKEARRSERGNTRYITVGFIVLIRDLTPARYHMYFFPSLESDDVGVLEFAQVFDLGLLDVPHFLHGHVVSVELAEEDGALRAAAHPLQVRDLLEGNLPGLCAQANRSKTEQRAHE